MDKNDFDSLPDVEAAIAADLAEDPTGRKKLITKLPKQSSTLLIGTLSIPKAL